MNKILDLLSLTLIPAAVMAAPASVTSPSGEMSLTVDVNAAGEPFYSLSYKGKQIVADSRLGLRGDELEFTRGFEITATDTLTADRSWKPVWGEYANIRDHFRELAVKFNAPDPVREMTVRFRLFDDGLGFRYELPPQQQGSYLTLRDETTEFNFGADHTLFCIPGDYDTDEYLWSETRFSGLTDALSSYPRHGEAQRAGGNTVQTPLLLKTADPVYINLHEAALTGYPAMLLDTDTDSFAFKTHLVPDRLGVAAYLQYPFNTPWRTLIVSDDARDILASQLILNLNEPCAFEDTSWIKPMKFMGVWWEMITGKSQWSYTNAENFDLATFDYSKAKPHGQHGANNANVKRYIDFAADNGFDQLLIEGWNIGWEDWFGKEKDFVFDFVTPYPDFDIKALNDYAHSKGIKLMMHHETSGSIPNYEAHMDTAYSLMNRFGYDAVKSGYVGHILPKGETHYSQWANNHYLNAIRKAAEHKIMVNAHEAVRPTGLARTYPNLVGNESAMGTEYRNMSPGHEAILPFTRLKGGPMDFTPGIFRMDMSSFVPGSTEHKKATVANQLGLYVTMYSPLQMAADMPEHYAEKMDAFQFIKDVPVDWSETIYLDAEPQDFIVAARRAKNGDSWWVGGITDEDARDYELALDFLQPDRTYTATIYADAPDADYRSNPEAYVITTREVKKGDVIPMHMAPGGGFAVAIR